MNISKRKICSYIPNFLHYQRLETYDTGYQIPVKMITYIKNKTDERFK